MKVGQQIIIQSNVYRIIDPPTQDVAGIITLKIASDTEATAMLNAADRLRAKA
jgi:hypothetical protein